MKSFVVLMAAALGAPIASAHPMFQTSDHCQACHNGMTTAKGDDFSIGIDWRSSVMAHSSRDPYWQASVRREVHEHASATRAIEDTCSACHMPMATVQARAEGRMGEVFANLGRTAKPGAALALDGVSCSVCHQIEPDRLGTPESYDGNFVVAAPGKLPRKANGPFEIKPPVARVMASATQFLPQAAAHIRQSEVCATCHTLYTDALDANGKSIGRFPEQVPYLEWLQSDYKGSVSCASCHMPALTSAAPIANILGEPREGVARHEFLGGNVLLPKMLKWLGVPMAVLPMELDAASARTRAFLSESAATIAIGDIKVEQGVLETRITLENSTGHKLPTAYPSRRAWLHIAIKDGGGRVVFQSGAVEPSGKIPGNDNDEDPSRFEPHHTTITASDQVQIYEPILGNAQGRVTTGLLQAVGYLKDNRLLPSGFDKGKVPADVAVHGEASGDADFQGGSDQVGLRVPIEKSDPPYTVEVELLYQPIGYRWAHNLDGFDYAETKAFLRAYNALSMLSYQRLASATKTSAPAEARP